MRKSLLQGGQQRLPGRRRNSSSSKAPAADPKQRRILHKTPDYSKPKAGSENELNRKKRGRPRAKSLNFDDVDSRQTTDEKTSKSDSPEIESVKRKERDNSTDLESLSDSVSVNADDHDAGSENVDVTQSNPEESDDVVVDDEKVKFSKSDENSSNSDSHERGKNIESNDELPTKDESDVPKYKKLDDGIPSKSTDHKLDEKGDYDLSGKDEDVASSSIRDASSEDNESPMFKNAHGLRPARTRSRGPNRPGIEFKIGARLEACDFMSKWYPSKIVDVDWKDQEVLIHFERWSSRFDEWVSMESPRLRAVTRTSARREHRQKLQQEFKVGDNVLARWADGKMYPAKIACVNGNGTCQVKFYDDGILKLVKLGYIQKISKEDFLLASAKAQPLTDKDKQPRSRGEGKEKKLNRLGAGKSSMFDDDSSSSATSKTKSSCSSAEKSNAKGKALLRSLKGPKHSAAYGLVMKRKKLLVGGIFQAKRIYSEAPKPKTSVAVSSKELPSPEIERADVPSEKSPENEIEIEKAALPTDDKGTACEEVAEGEVSSAKKKRLSGGVAPKEFIIEEDHNHYKCTVEDCGKAFRKESLLASHMKHYHNKSKKEKSLRKKQLEANGPHVKSAVKKEEVQATEMPEDVIKEAFEIATQPENVPKNVKDTPTLTKDEQQHVEVKEKKGRGKVLKDVAAAAKDGNPRPRRSSSQKRLSGDKGNSTASAVSDDVKPNQNAPVNEKPKGVKRKLPSKEKITVKKESLGLANVSRDSGHAKKRKTADDNEPWNSHNADMKIKEELTIKREEDVCVKDKACDFESELSAVQSALPETVPETKKMNKKRRLEFSGKKSKDDDSAMNTPLPDSVENFCDYDDAEDIREEVVNCICRFTEEDGLMMQCENCMAWQHGTCFNIEEEDRVPERYICFACLNPKAQRKNHKYWYEQGWWKSGELANFNFLPSDGHQTPTKFSVLKAHSLTNSINVVNRVLHSLRFKLHVAGTPDLPEIQHWKRSWIEGSSPGGANATPNHVKRVAGNGELTYFDHSYSAVNRKTSYSSGVLSSNLKLFREQIKDEFLCDKTEDSKSDAEQYASPKIGSASNSAFASNYSNGQASLSLSERESTLKNIKKEDESAPFPDGSSGSSKLRENSDGAAPGNNIDSANHAEPDKVEVSSNLFNLNASKINRITCQLNLLDHIEQLQEEVDRKLEEISQHVEALESEWDVSCQQERLTDAPSLKKTISVLENNLTKVERMATHF